MPTVPSLGQQATPSPLRGAGFTASPVPNAQPQQLEQLGNVTARAGASLANVAIDMHQQVNQVRVDDGLNKVRQRVLDLTFNNETGYKTLRGDAALTRPQGKILPDEYGSKLETSINEVAGTLGNDVQRQIFSQQATNLLAQFRAGVEQHTLEEYRKFSLSTQDGTIKLSAEEAKRNWQNPDQIKSSLDSVRAAVVRSGSLQGWSANETTARMQQTVSAVHSNVIDAALQENNPEYALGYLDRFKDQMTADDVLKVRGVINRDVYQRAADNIAVEVVSAARAQVAPNDLSRMAAITAQSESGNRERDAAGNLITSAKGAQGAMQVMPGTRVDPGFGVAPAKDDSDAERTRVGRDYLQAMVKRYAGDPQKAWAAYNWGPGKLDAAIAEHGAEWLAHAPKETRDYVVKNMAALGSNAALTRPTLQNIHDQVRAQVTARFGDTPPAGVLKLALASSTQQFEDMQKAIKADEDAKVTGAMQLLVQNGGRFSQLPYAVRSTVPADKLDNLLSFASRVAKGDDVTNPAVYQRLSDPAALRRLSDDQFYQLRGELSESDFKHFSAQRAAATGKTTDKLQEINLQAMNSTLRDRFQMLGMDPTPKDGSDEAGRVGAIKKFVTDSMLARQRTTGKQMTDAEVSQHIDELFAKSVSFRTSVLGIETGKTSQRLLTMKASDIPSETRAALEADFTAAGIPEPTEADLLGAYFRLKNMPPPAPRRRDTAQSKTGMIIPKGNVNG